MFYVGLDLGKKHDHSAIAIVEKTAGHLLVRRVERVPLGTPYERVVELVRDLVTSPALYGRCALAVDGSGVGEPVMEMFRRTGLGCEVTAVTITGGAAQTKTRSGVKVPKRDLIGIVQLALEKGELKIARRMKEAGALVKELLDVRANANGSFGAEGTGEHDDLVIAVALACWRARRRENGFGSGRLI